MKTFLALYLGEPSEGPPPNLSQETINEGMAAWGGWMTKHAVDVIYAGGPVGKTKQASKSGLSDTRNRVGGFIVIQAETHDAAVKMFEGHPHFSIFPGESVEVMEVLPIPGT